jgi:hypothetical protein
VNYNNIAICGEILTNLFISIKKIKLKKESPIGNGVRSTFGGLLLNPQI